MPVELADLSHLARNLAWTWDNDARELFAQLDAPLWERTNHNPVELLRLIDPSRLTHAAADPTYRRRLAEAAARPGFTDSVQSPQIAYFSAEFALAECLPTYSGGLGVLAGDHLKAASDRGLALIGVGLFYRQGYFRQVLSEDGRQLELYPDLDPATLPLEPVRDHHGGPLELELPCTGRRLAARTWCVRVGRARLYLMDTDFEENDPIDRELTGRLYGGDHDLRLRQEILLGIGGLRLVRALGHRPSVFHLNEGHASFAALERVRELMQERRLSLAEARGAAAPGLVFTTHTPVPAGNDVFSPDMLEEYFEAYYQEMGISSRELLGLGREDPDDDSEPFSMTVLALRLCGVSNAVSQLHGVIARRMWRRIWPHRSTESVPIGAITNGVHLPSWLAPELGPPRDATCSATSEARAPSDDDDALLWARHERLRARLIDFTRRRLASQLGRRGAKPAELAWAANVLDPAHLTIGFARRFTAYKRADLLLGDPERLVRLISCPDRPLQLVFAGKAHPRDEPGKALIQELMRLIRKPKFRERIVFLEEYDLNVARHLVQGCDVWLNTPRRPLEASGTSGMKAAANGVLHLSTLDGWWDEAFRPGLGWAIGERREYSDPAEQDEVDRASLFDLLEREVGPLFYRRDAAGLPRGWLAMIRSSMQAFTQSFSADRMLAEYEACCYGPAIQFGERSASPL